jgi:hypothetical protein
LIQNGAHLIRAVDDRIRVFPPISNNRTRLLFSERCKNRVAGNLQRRLPSTLTF